MTTPTKTETARDLERMATAIAVATDPAWSTSPASIVTRIYNNAQSLLDYDKPGRDDLTAAQEVHKAKAQLRIAEHALQEAHNAMQRALRA